jgi:hypothetical protein
VKKPGRTTFELREKHFHDTHTQRQPVGRIEEMQIGDDEWHSDETKKVLLGDIEHIRRCQPGLSSNGWKYGGTTREDHEKYRADMTSPHSLEEFMRAREYLARCKRRKLIWKGSTSYGWKHQAEFWLKWRYPGRDPYVSNGMFIAAAIVSGCKIHRISDSPNCWLNISKNESLSRDGTGLIYNPRTGSMDDPEAFFGPHPSLLAAAETG